MSVTITLPRPDNSERAKTIAVVVERHLDEVGDPVCRAELLVAVIAELESVLADSRDQLVEFLGDEAIADALLS